MESYFEGEMDGDDFDEAAFGENPPVLISEARQIREVRNMREHGIQPDPDARSDEVRMHHAEEPSLYWFRDEEEIMSYDDWA
jgi:hypothetical protein